MPIDLLIEADTEPTVVAWRTLVAMRDEIGLPNLKIDALQNFSCKLFERRLTSAERTLIVDQARQLFEHFYVHAPFKQRDGAPDPLELLSKVRAELEHCDEHTFHQRMLMVFLSQNDAHTLYGLPEPSRNSLAFLPFQIQSFTDETGTERFVVSKLMKAFAHPDFVQNVEIVSWSGRPILEAVLKSAEEEVGGNEAAFMANGLIRMCLRPLTYALAPEQFEETIEYIPLDARSSKETKTITVPWGVSTGMDASKTFTKSTGSSADHLAQKRKGSMVIWTPDKCKYEYSSDTGELDSTFKEIFEFQLPNVSERQGFLKPEYLSCKINPDALYGYIRVKNFDLHFKGAASREGEVAQEFKRILELQMKHAPDGLILDLRGNPGGNVRLAEMMLQMLTPKQIQPAKFHWRLNETVRKALEKVGELKTKFPAFSEDEERDFNNLVPEFDPWNQDLAPAMASELPEFLTSGKEVTESASANDTGQVYQGPVVLIIDAFTYSAGDIFAGGFRDHDIGPILGIHSSTGGGGATVKQHADLVENLAQSAGVQLQQLPAGITMSVAVLRSTRVLSFDGQPIEGVGVGVTETYTPTKRDVLEGNPELIARATSLLGTRKAHRYRLQVVEAKHSDGGLSFTIAHSGIAKLQWEPQLKLRAHAKGNEGKWRIEAGFDEAADQDLTLSGLDGDGNLVVSTRARIPGILPAESEPSRETSPLVIEDAQYVNGGIELRVSGDNQENLAWALKMRMKHIVEESPDGLRIRAEFDRTQAQKLSIVGFKVQGEDDEFEEVIRASVTLGAS